MQRWELQELDRSSRYHIQSSSDWHQSSLSPNNKGPSRQNQTWWYLQQQIVHPFSAKGLLKIGTFQRYRYPRLRLSDSYVPMLLPTHWQLKMYRSHCHLVCMLHWRHTGRPCDPPHPFQCHLSCLQDMSLFAVLCVFASAHRDRQDSYRKKVEDH